MKLDSETANLKSNVEQFRFAQKEILAHPFLYDPESVNRLTNVSSKGLVGLPESANVLVPLTRTPLDYIENIHKSELDKLGKQTDTEISMAGSRQGIVSALKDNERRLGDWYDVKVKENPGLFGRISKDDFIKATKTNYNTESFSGSLYSTDRRSSGSRAPKQELYPTNVQGTTRFNIPSSMGQTVKKYEVGKAIDPETGKVVEINDAVEVKPISFGDDGMIIGEVGGGQLMRGKEPLFSTKSMDGQPKSDKLQNGRTEAQLKAKAFDLLSAKADKPESGKWSNVENVSLVKDEDGNYTLKGTVKAYKGRLGSNFEPGEELNKYAKEVASKEVEIPIEPVRDESAKRQLKFPLKDYRNLLAGQEKSYKIGDVPVGEYLDKVQDGTATKSAESKPTISVTEYNKAKGTNYTRQQIEKAFGSQYQIED